MNYTLKETLISSLINALFSIAFFIGMFHNEPQLILGGASRLTMDFLPQAFFVGLFAALPSSLLTLKRLKTGAIEAAGRKRLPLPRSLPIRVAFLASGSLMLFGGGAVILFSLMPPMVLSFSAVLAMKAAYGILISLVTTPIAVGYLMCA